MTPSFYARRPILPRRLGVLFAALSLAACGGGGGGSSTPTPTPPPVSSTVVSGKITFERVPFNASNGLNYSATFALPARGVNVELVADNGTVVASGQTDDAGDYSLTANSGQSLRLRVRAEMIRTGTPSWDYRVVDNTAGDALFALEGPASVTDGDTQTRDLLAETGWDGSAYAAVRSAAPFAILDSVYDATLKVTAELPQAQFAPLTLHWSENNRTEQGNIADGAIVTSYYTRNNASGSEIYLLGAADNDTDEYDTHVVIHEWGHYFEDRFSRSDSVGGSHSGGDRLDPRVAFSEGFGYALAGMVTDDPVSRDSGGFGQARGFQIDVEDDNPLTNVSGNLNPGWYSEGSVQLILYDLYDDTSDGVDTLSLGFGPLLDVFLGDFATDTATTSIFAFAEALRAARPADAAGINSLLEAKSIAGAGNDAFGSGETNNAGNTLDVLPVFTNVQPNGVPVTVCSIGGDPAGPPDNFGTFNKLSNRRLLRLPITTAGRYRIAVTGGDDADLVLFRGEFITIAQEEGDDTIERDLTPGDYVVEVYEYANVFPDDTAAPSGRYCLDVTVRAI